MGKFKTSLFSIVLFLLLFDSVHPQQKRFYPWKTWAEYDSTEKPKFYLRWTDRKKELIYRALKDKTPFPQFVELLEWKESDLKDIPESEMQNAINRAFDLRGINLSEKNLRKVDFRFLHLEGAILSEAILDSADFRATYLDGAYLEKTDLANANLSLAKMKGAFLDEANLEGAYLGWIDLQNASLRKTNLRRANFVGRAELQEADLSDADLTDADIFGANIRGAKLNKANLSKAYIGYSRLNKADLRGANLYDTDFFGTHFDSTCLSFTNFGEARNIRYIVWGDEQSPRYLIGEEKLADSLRAPLFYRMAINTYRDLKNVYEKEGMNDIVKEFHYRENEVKTNSYSWLSPIKWIRIVFLKWTYGYGSRPMLLLQNGGIIIVVFMLIFFVMALFKSNGFGISVIRSNENGQKTENLLSFNKKLLWDCFRFSLLAFCTFGYGALQLKNWLEYLSLEPIEYKPFGWSRILVWLESGIGIYLFALFVVVLLGD